MGSLSRKFLIVLVFLVDVFMKIILLLVLLWVIDLGSIDDSDGVVGVDVICVVDWWCKWVFLVVWIFLINLLVYFFMYLVLLVCGLLMKLIVFSLSVFKVIFELVLV